MSAPSVMVPVGLGSNVAVSKASFVANASRGQERSAFFSKQISRDAMNIANWITSKIHFGIRLRTSQESGPKIALRNIQFDSDCCSWVRKVSAKHIWPLELSRN